MEKKLITYAVSAALGLGLLGSATAVVAASEGTQASAQTFVQGAIMPSRTISALQFGDVHRIKRNLGLNFELSPLQPTGFWAKVGDRLVVELKSSSGVSPKIYIHNRKDSSYSYTGAQRVALQPGLNTIDITKDGEIYIVTNNESVVSANVEVTLKSGGRAMPMFVLGQHSDGDLQRMLDAFPDAPHVHFVSDNFFSTVIRENAVKYTNKPTEMLNTWEEVIRLGREQYGLDDTSIWPSADSQPRVHFVDYTDGAMSYGYMFAWRYRLGASSKGSIRDVIDADKFKKSWGPWHEYGHLIQIPSMTWKGLTEVTVNLTSLYVQRALGNESRLEASGNWDRVIPTLNTQSIDYNSIGNLFDKAAMFWQLDLTFGKAFYRNLGQRYRDLEPSHRPTSDFDKQQTFIRYASLTSGYDLTPFFQAWGLSPSSDTRYWLTQQNLEVLVDPIWENRDSDIKYSYAIGEGSDGNTDTGEVDNGQVTSCDVWLPGTTYAAAGSVVEWNNRTWENGWWTRGEEPGTTGQWGVWREVSSPSCVGNEGQDSDVDSNQAPVSHIQASTVELTGSQSINLDGSMSYDADGDTLSHHWQQVSPYSPIASIANQASSSTSVTFPEVKQTTQYKFSLTVSDGRLSHTSYVNITQNAEEQGDVTLPDTDSKCPTWEAGKTYAQPNNVVSWNGGHWVNHWWTKNEEPGSTGQWGVWRPADASSC